MCLAIPARVVALLENGMATVDLDGVRLEISLALVDEVQVDDYVIVHVGYALHKLDRGEAEETLRLIAEVMTPPSASDATLSADSAPSEATRP